LNREELVNKLNEIGKADQNRTAGQAPFARFLAHYVAWLPIQGDKHYVFWDIDDRIPQIMVGAISTFEKSEDSYVRASRSAYERETGHTFSDPTHVDSGNNIVEVRMIEMIMALITEVTGHTLLATKIDALLNAERRLVLLGFYRFLDQVYAPYGLHQTITENGKQGMSGTFGKTTLRSHMANGRLTFMFLRGSGQNAKTVSFVSTMDEPLLGLGRSDLQSCYCSLHTALAMIDDVIGNWYPTTFTVDRVPVATG
jgi:hypothetical protein